MKTVFDILVVAAAIGVIAYFATVWEQSESSLKRQISIVLIVALVAAYFYLCYDLGTNPHNYSRYQP